MHYLLKKEKSDIFIHSLFIGLALIILYFFQFILLNFAVFLLAFNGLSQEQITTALYDTWTGYLINTIISVLTLTFPFLILKIITKQPVYKTCRFNSSNSGLSVFCVTFTLGISVLANYFTSVLNIVLEQFFGFEAVQHSIGDNSFAGPFEMVYTFLAVAVIPALIEEFAFRGMILGSLRKFGDMPAVLFSAVLFALLHGNFIQIPFALILGIALGITVVITDSIWPAIISHLLVNSYAVLLNALPNDQESSNLAFYFLMLLVALGVISFLIIRKKNGFKKIKDVTSNLRPSSRFIRMALSPTMIIFILYMLYIAFQSRVQ